VLPSHQLIEGLINFAIIANNAMHREAPLSARFWLPVTFYLAMMDIEGRLQFAASDVSPPPYIEQHFLD
jgi:hypothetical protein